MLTVTVLFAALLISASLIVADEEARLQRGPPNPSADDACIEKPCGPFVCQARCVASCLDTSLATNVAECAERFCQNFDDNSPCPLNDTACWKTCGFPQSDDDKPGPSLPDDLRLGMWTDGFSSANTDPRNVRVEWPATKDATLYIVEAFPMFGKDPSSNNQHVLKNMTTETSFTFQRSDLCNVYMVRVMAVNGFGVSAPRYLVVDAWKPELHFDENFDIRYIRREDDYVKVRIDYAPPSTWNRDDVTFENTFVRAHDCLETVDQEVFLSSQPDDEGFFTPMVLINESATAIELAFPAKIMFSKCLYSYRVAALRTSCNATITMDPKSGAGVDFALNCLSVENSDCQSTNSDSKENSTAGQSEEIVILGGPEAMKELQSENATAPTGPSDSKEVVIVVNGDALKELQEESTTPPTPPAKQERAEEAVAALPEAIKELENERAAPSSTIPSVDDATQASDESHEAEKSKEDPDMQTPPSPLVDGDNDGPPPRAVVVEPQDPNAPFCGMAEFDAEVVINADKDSSEEQPVAVGISWLENSPPGLVANHFLIRYGPVTRTLIVDAQPDIIDETVIRSPQTDGSSEELSRVLKVTGLAPNGLYAFQICAMYNPSADPTIAWDMVPRHVVDLSAINSAWRGGEIDAPLKQVGSSNAEQNSTKNELDFVDAFINALNSSFNNAQEAASTQDQGTGTGAEKTDGSAELNGVLELNSPMQPQIVNIDVKPIVITETTSWSPVRMLWLILALALLAVTVSAFMFFVLRRTRGRRHMKTQKFQPTTLATVYQTPVPTVASEVKVPMP